MPCCFSSARSLFYRNRSIHHEYCCNSPHSHALDDPTYIHQYLTTWNTDTFNTVLSADWSQHFKTREQIFFSPTVTGKVFLRDFRKGLWFRAFDARFMISGRLTYKFTGSAIAKLPFVNFVARSLLLRFSQWSYKSFYRIYNSFPL